MLDSRQRAHLRGLANPLDSLFQIGKAGLSDAVCAQFDEALTARVSEFERGLNEGKAFLSQGLMFFLRDWLKNHIQGVDKQYSTLLQEKGVV